jgi:hypothetical protein
MAYLQPEGFLVVGRLTIRLPIRIELLRQGHGKHGTGERFQRFDRGNELAHVWRMDENSNPRSAANLGVFVVMAVVPIVAYFMAVLVLPWVGRGFH